MNKGTTMHLMRANQARQRGPREAAFSLIEVSFAMAILMTVMTAVIVALQQSTQLATRLTEETVAIMLAQGAIEQYGVWEELDRMDGRNDGRARKNTYVNPSGAPVSLNGRDYTITLDVDDVPGFNDDELMQLTATADSGRYQVSFLTYVARY